MKVEITDPVEIHLLLAEKYQKSTVNIVVRTKIDYCPTSTQLKVATTKLVNQHPYLNARYFIEEKSEKVKYYYEELIENQYEVDFHHKTTSELNKLMDTLSPMRTYCFSLERGKLFRVVVYQDQNSSIIEFSIAHIVGEVPSALTLMGNLLRHLDQSISGLNTEIVKQKKYIFNERDFGWSDFVLQEMDVEVSKENTSNVNPWKMPEIDMVRQRLPSETFSRLKNWINTNNINTKVSDVFYFIADKLLTGMLNKSPEFWLIMSYRNSLKEHNINSTIYNFAFFAPVMSDQFDQQNIRNWLEDFYQYRNGLITQEGICLSRSFFHNLNKFMEGTDLETGKNIMNSVVKFPDFAFNNYGEIDKYIGTQNHFNVIDIDIQDGTPAQEIRYFTFNKELYINPAFFENRGIDTNQFWDQFIHELNRLFISKQEISIPSNHNSENSSAFAS